MKTTISLAKELQDSIKTHKDFVSAYGITMDVVKVDGRPAMDDWGKAASHWVCVLQSQVHTGHVLTYYSMGSAHKGKPKTADILQSLALDSCSAHEDFESWCYEFGSDVDSIKSRATWKACRKASADLVEWLGQDDFDVLMACEEE